MSVDLDLPNVIFLAFALVFMFEGILYSLFPNYMKKISIVILNLSLDRIRFLGFIFCFIGIIILYLI